MTNQFAEVYGITEDDVRELAKQLPSGVTIETVLRNIKILKIRYGLTNDSIQKLVQYRLDLIASNDILDRLTIAQSKYRISDDRMAEMFNSWRVRFFDLDFDYLTKIQNEVRLTQNEISSVITHSKMCFQKTDVNIIKKNLEILETAGLTRRNLRRGISMLSSNPKRTVDMIMIAMMQGYDVNAFVLSNYQRVKADVAYSRFMAEREGVVPKGLVYSADLDFAKYSKGLTEDALIVRYCYDYKSRILLEREFLEKFEVAPKLIGLVAQGFIDFSNQDKIDKGYQSPENAMANRKILMENTGLLDFEVDSLIERCPELETFDSKLLEHNLSVLRFSVGRLNLIKCLNAFPKIFTTERNEIMMTFKTLHEKFGITKSEYSYMILNNPALPTRDISPLDDFSKFYIENYGASNEQVKNFIIANSYVCLDEKLYKERIAVLNAFGATPTILDGFESPARGATDSLILKMKLALINGLSISEFVDGRYKQSAHKTYARMRGYYAGGVAFESIYPKKGKNLNNHIIDENDKNLMRHYPLNESAVENINKVFARRFPQIQEKLDLLGKQKEEEKEEVSSNRSAIEALRRRFKRICAITEEQADELLSKVGPLDGGLFTKVVLNIYNLKKMGFLIEDIIEMPRILKCDPESIKIKLAIANMAGLSGNQFIKRNYRYSAETTYAKIMEAKEQGVVPHKLYDANNDYLKSLKRRTGIETSIDELKKKHPLDEETMHEFLAMYDESAEENKSE